MQPLTHIRSEPENILEDQSFLSDKYDFLMQLTVFFGFQYFYLILRCIKLENSGNEIMLVCLNFLNKIKT